MPLIRIEDPTKDIWKTNPTLELVSEFKAFKKKHGAKKSSQILTAIYLIWDPKSPLRDSGMSEDDVIVDICSNYLDDPDFEWGDYDEIRELYLKYNLSKAEKLLLEYEQELESRNKLLSDWKWDVDDPEGALKKDRMLLSSKKIWDEYIEIRDRVRDEWKDNAVGHYGNYRKSFIESYA